MNFPFFKSCRASLNSPTTSHSTFSSDFNLRYSFFGMVTVSGAILFMYLEIYIKLSYSGGFSLEKTDTAEVLKKAAA